MTRLYSGNLTGVSYEPAKTNIREAGVFYKHTDEIELRPNPNNKYDKFALEAWLRCPDGGAKFIGHIPRPVNVSVIRSGLHRVQARLLHFNAYEGVQVGAAVEIVQMPAVVKATADIGERMIRV
jgi:hypothetical protein